MRDIFSLKIETPRLLLRPQRREDFEPWAAMMADPEGTRFINGPHPRAAAWRGFMTVAGCWALQGFSLFSVIEKSSGRWIGRLGPWMPEGWPGPEVGWALVREAWNRGYATEGAAAAIDWAFEHLGWGEIIHVIAPDNLASQALAAKLGSRKRGPGRLPPPSQDARVDIWGQTRAEWIARRPRR
ncbi:MAG TPA: GNAT family N-acetyltransferase [Steroidobacteraceae bacterium]|jgi:RimJ/RimL family protein N-acetyltransferase|nr:GNAT family N-acetyltransferase [Steroidobacteraceae bacterium]